LDFIDYAKQRYEAAIAEINRLKNSEFPYDQIREALVALEDLFTRQVSSLKKLKLTSSPSIAKNACGQTLACLFGYTPFLGFIVRATNVRNAFEVYSPALRLAKQLLGPDTKLLLSSEWDYSPFILMTPELPNFVLIGVPAFESSNPLIMSLAGHELGHNAWSKEMLGRKHDPDIKKEVLTALMGKHWAEFTSFQPTATHANLTTDMFVQPAWLPAFAYASRQLEEIFCDMMGLRIFGEAFLHAFAYLLSPGIPGERYPLYPSVVIRARHLEAASKLLGVDCPTGYQDLFSKEQDITSPATRLLCSVADDATAQLVDKVTKDAFRIADDKGLPTRDPAKVQKIVESFAMVAPTDGRNTMTDIINAGWICKKRDDLWTNVPQIRPETKSQVLADLILKSLEITEFYDRLGSP